MLVAGRLKRVVADGEATGPINALVNAGMGIMKTMMTSPQKNTIKYQVNQYSVFYGMKTILPSMRRASGDRSNISSIGGLVGMPDSGVFATKFAIRGMTMIAL